MQNDQIVPLAIMTAISLIVIHVGGKLAKWLWKKITEPRQSQDMIKLEKEIKEIKTFIKELTEARDQQLIQSINQQSGSIASISQNFQQFVTIQEEFQRTFLQTQTKLMYQLQKTMSQRTGSNNNQSISSIPRGELSFLQKPDSPRSQADSFHRRSSYADQSILSQGNTNMKTKNQRRRMDIQPQIQEVTNEQNYGSVKSESTEPQILTPRGMKEQQIEFTQMPNSARNAPTQQLNNRKIRQY